jgi:hypothetical protein
MQVRFVSSKSTQYLEITLQSRQSAKLFLHVGIGTPPSPHPQASVHPLPSVLGEGAYLLAREGL